MDSLQDVLLDCLRDHPHGLCAQIARETCLTETELSFFRNQHRLLTPAKTLALADFLLATGRLSFTSTIIVKEQG